MGGLPIIGHWVVHGLAPGDHRCLRLPRHFTLIGIRLRNRPGSPWAVPFTGSTMWQGYFVEVDHLRVLVCGS